MPKYLGLLVPYFLPAVVRALVARGRLYTVRSATFHIDVVRTLIARGQLYTITTHSTFPFGNQTSKTGLKIIWRNDKTHGAVCTTVSTPHAAPTQYGQRGQLSPLPPCFWFGAPATADEHAQTDMPECSTMFGLQTDTV